jgi:hypothetical protein
MLLLWAVWISAVQGTLAARGWTFVPDLGVVLLVALAARIEPADLGWLALALALGRASVGVDPVPALVAAYFLVVALVRALRNLIDVQGPIVQVPLAALSAGGLLMWLGVAHRARLPRASVSALEDLGRSLPGPWAVALASALAALLLGPLFARLPGLSPLARRKTWRVAGSYR